MDRPDQPDRDEQDVARLLRAVGRREELPRELKQRWEQQFRAELQPVLERRRRTRRTVVMSLCAGLAAIAVGISVLLPAPTVSGVTIRVSQAGPGDQYRVGDAAPRALQAGQILAPGTVVSTGADSHAAINYAGYDLRLHNATRMAFTEERVDLHAGEIYASDLAGAQQLESLVIKTPHGVIRDIGTQFTVALQPDRTVTTVRRGAVLLNTGSEEIRAEAGRGTATRLSVDRERRVQRETVASSGSDWRWIYRGGAGFELEGQSAYDFLQWSVGESGMQLEFASDGAEIYSRTTLLHGDISRLDPEQAVRPVLATTDLVAEATDNNRLLVSLRLRY